MSLTEKERREAWLGISHEEYKKFIRDPASYFDSMIKPGTSQDDAEYIRGMKQQMLAAREMQRLEALREGPDFGTRMSWWLQKWSRRIDRPFIWAYELIRPVIAVRWRIAQIIAFAFAGFVLVQMAYFNLGLAHGLLGFATPVVLLVISLFDYYDNPPELWARTLIMTALVWLVAFTQLYVFTAHTPAMLLVKNSGGQREVILSRESFLIAAPSILRGDTIAAYTDGPETAECIVKSPDGGMELRVTGRRNLIRDKVLPIIDQGIDYSFVLGNFNHILYASTDELARVFSNTGRITQEQLLKFVEVTRNDLFFISDVKVEVTKIEKNDYGSIKRTRVF